MAKEGKVLKANGGTAEIGSSAGSMRIRTVIASRFATDARILPMIVMHASNTITAAEEM